MITWHGESFTESYKLASKVVGLEMRHVEMSSIKRCQTLVSVKHIVHDIEYPDGGGKDVELKDKLGQTSLSTFLAFPKQFSATDPRDKIFALLELARDIVAGENDLQPDYRVPRDELFPTFARFSVSKERRLDIWHRVGARRSLQMPSWVPYWSISTNEGQLPLDSFEHWAAEHKSDQEVMGPSKYRGKMTDIIKYASKKLRI
jgi:hypothetical protein